MKYGIAYVTSWILYWMGDWISYPIFYFNILGYFYPVYNTLMFWSICVQDKYAPAQYKYYFPWNHTTHNPYACCYWGDE